MPLVRKVPSMYPCTAYRKAIILKKLLEHSPHEKSDI